MVSAILSPHLDDAVLSCWHLLAQPGDVRVINVFAGVPSATAGAWWDQLTGATDSSQRMRERLAEDRAALAHAERLPVNLDFLDHQYRDAEQALSPLVTQIEAALAPGAHVYAPAAIGAHADHELVRAAALELRERGFSISLYADLPHANQCGWPAWVTGDRPAERPNLAAVTWDLVLAATGVLPDTIAPVVHRLDPRSHTLKLSAVRAYATQLNGLELMLGQPLTDRDALGYEVVWALPAVATPSPAYARHRAGPHL